MGNDPGPLLRPAGVQVEAPIVEVEFRLGEFDELVEEAVAQHGIGDSRQVLMQGDSNQVLAIVSRSGHRETGGLSPGANVSEACITQALGSDLLVWKGPGLTPTGEVAHEFRPGHDHPGALTDTCNVGPTATLGFEPPARLQSGE